MNFNASRTFIGILFFFATLSSDAQSDKTSVESVQFDQQLANDVGADDYGMRSYVFVMLLTGPNDGKITDEKQRNKIFKGHFANMARLANEGKLVLAGPFIEANPRRGLYIFNVKTIEEAKSLVVTDPAVAAGIFIADYTKYYGSAALMKLQSLHQKIQKVKF